MKTTTLFRLSGLATIIGGVGFAIGEILIAIFFPESLPFSQRFAGLGLAVVEALEIPALILLLLGTIGLYIHQQKASGTFGFIGFLLAFIGTVWSIGEGWTSAFLFSGLSSAVPQFLDSLIIDPPTMAAIGVGLGFILFPLGWILFSVATLRSKVFSRWSGVLVIVGVLLIPFLPIIANLLLGAGWSWMGYSVWATARTGEQASE
jgi:uncharacterized membrane protein YciS (DUF1049 family)